METDSRPALVKLTLLLSLLCFIPAQARAFPYGVNLLTNPGAEDGPASTTGDPVASVPGWTVNGGFTVVSYGAPGYPTTSQGPPDGGNQFFAGGANAAEGDGTQVIDISANATNIDTGNVTIDVSAYLGGFADQEDNAVLSVDFRNGMASTGPTFQLGPVTAAQRNNQTVLLEVYNSALVPTGTRQLVVKLVMTRVFTGGNANDGYADNLSVSLRKPYVVTTTADSGPGSLREALTVGNPITFDPSTFSAAQGPQVIMLATELPEITYNTTIEGPGSDLLSIQATASLNSLIIQGGNSMSPPTVSISKLAAQLISSDSANLYLSHVNVIGGHPASFAVSVSDGTASLSSCSISNNRSEGLDLVRTKVTCTDCSFRQCANDGVHAFSSDLTLSACTISGGAGRGLESDGDSSASSTVALNNCTISNNAGIAVQSVNYNSVSLLNCTVV